ncbi:methionine ABC transporter ATP-binding protein [Silvimonas sp.]|uniref:methionine ABC transporter ATP-binding protein n=1 Tax=Silvimonas sp. TaxID=2650811 RepID=UPI0028438429|nr:methionine ABC transporter ATP-binding protein [Silvimonas sp.]MDR3430077.1 methionine ABC transporter ATP-binding protein [Silvimonas sp.]
MIEFIDVHKSFNVDGRAIPALNGIDLKIEAGEIFGIIGHSGAGKSTLVRLINLLEKPTSGRVLIDGVEITASDSAQLREQRRGIGMIFQHFNLLSSKTVADNVAFPLKLAGMYSSVQIKDRVEQLLARVGLADHANKYPAQLSGGQKQRVGIARALATNPKVLLCDEATSALDPQTTQSVLQLLAEINREFNLTIVVITHEMDVIRRIGDRVAVLDAGRVVEVGNVADVFLHPQHVTTQRFVQEAENVDEAEETDAYAHVPGRIVRLTFRGEQTYEPVLGQVARETGVDFSILSGRIDRIKDTPYGQLILSITGGQPEIALQRFSDAGLTVEILRG